MAIWDWHWLDYECGYVHTCRYTAAADIMRLYEAEGLGSDEVLSVKFEHPNRNTLEYTYIDGTWQNLNRTVLDREQFYLRFFQYDTVTINITEREE